MYSTKLYEDSKVYGLILAMSIFDCKLLTHMPWLKGDFVQASNGYPTLGLLRLCLVFTLVQLIPTFAAQIGTFVVQHNTISSNKTVLTVLVINVMFSSLKFAIAVLDIVLKYNALDNNDTSHSKRRSIFEMSVYPDTSLTHNQDLDLSKLSKSNAQAQTVLEKWDTHYKASRSSKKHPHDNVQIVSSPMQEVDDTRDVIMKLQAEMVKMQASNEKMEAAFAKMEARERDEQMASNLETGRSEDINVEVTNSHSL